MSNHLHRLHENFKVLVLSKPDATLKHVNREGNSFFKYFTQNKILLSVSQEQIISENMNRANSQSKTETLSLLRRITELLTTEADVNNIIN